MKGKDITNPERPVKKLCTHFNVLIDSEESKVVVLVCYVYVKTILFFLYSRIFKFHHNQ